MPDSYRNKLPVASSPRPKVVVIWIDWYAYHVARFRGLDAAPSLSGYVTGIELVGGVGVHSGLKFREPLPVEANIQTLEPEASWGEVDKLRLAAKLWRRLSRLQPAVVLVPGYYTLPAVAAAIWARLHGASSVLMTESCAFDHIRTPWKENLKGLGLRLLFNWAVAGGRAHVDYLQLLGFPLDRIAASYDVVDNDMYHYGAQILREQQERTQKRSCFLYVGRLAAEKNVSTLLESWLAYRQQGGSWSLCLVGDGPEAAALKSLARSSPYASEIDFPGLKSSRELLPFYAAAGCFVLPSVREPWGLVVNEAMAAALPVIVSNRCGCAPDLVEEARNGFLFNPLDGTTLCGLLHRVEQLSPDQHAEMSSASAEIIQRYTPQRFGLSIAAIAEFGRNSEGTQPTTAPEAQ